MWRVQINGGPNRIPFEISVVNNKITEVQRHYGWFDENKLLITHNGGPCSWPLTDLVWNKVTEAAIQVARTLNS
jgi:hypothetical protein